MKQFGRYPNKFRKKQFKNLNNFKDKQFQNPIHTPSLAEGENMFKILKDFFGKHTDTEPVSVIPSIKIDLYKLNPSENVLVWFGHSSYFIQIDGKKFLVDPVLSGSASPVPGSIKEFKGADIYKPVDIPEIDYLLITHDHWDHLDYKTIQQIKGKVKIVICGLGVAQHFEHWNWDTSKIIERNWYDTIQLDDDFEITLTPSRHFSGRLLKRNRSLWTSYVLKTPTKQLFLGGDSGYSPHFKEIGNRFGEFDLAILECGQYNKKWPYIHSFPEDLLTEANDLNAKHVLPVHHSKFRLSQHPWYEPLERVTAAFNNQKIPLITPKIGEPIQLENLNQHWEKWWK